MKTPLVRAFLALLLLAVAAGAALPAAGAGQNQRRVLAVEFDNDVNPVTADYLTGQIERANDEEFDAVAILLDTPGGLLDSMRKITKEELASEIPVLVYVSPDGARAASAGVWIGQAADLLAMAPQTNIGSSTPVGVGGEDIQKDLRRKAVNDAAASLRALAKRHGRNARWADRAVRRASNLSAEEALRRNVIDFIAPTLPALLERSDGFRTKPKGFELDLAGAEIETVHMSLWKRILDTLIDPNLIVLLMSLGALGIVVELWNPGLIFPGTVGAISLVLGFFGLSVLPVSWAGILLMLLAAGFFAAEPFVPSHGALSLAGATSFVFGALLLFDPAGPAYEVSLPVVLAIAATLALSMA
ncbi:MAG: nodulation protein NfeD, partial [Actinomycetota bacterium]|nr:nodulation protein NfeD [Actinomycetota bacterium]